MQVIAYEQLHPQQQADTDQHLRALWLQGRPASTQSAYACDVQRFLTFADKPLRSVTLGDVQAFADSLNEKAPSTRRSLHARPTESSSKYLAA